MTDAEILRAAIEAAGLSARRFALEVLDVDERTVRRWLAGENELHGTVRLVCLAIVRRRKLAEELQRVWASRQPEVQV